MSDVLSRLRSSGPIIPVLNFSDEVTAGRVCRTLYDKGFRVFEFTLRHRSALAIMQKMIEHLPDDALVGAGTILSADQIIEAKSVGAEFLVSPGLTNSIVDAAKHQAMPLLPGIATVSEAMQAADQGFTFLKFFPAEASGGAECSRHSLAGHFMLSL